MIFFGVVVYVFFINLCVFMYFIVSFVIVLSVLILYFVNLNNFGSFVVDNVSVSRVGVTSFIFIIVLFMGGIFVFVLCVLICVNLFICCF